MSFELVFGPDGSHEQVFCRTKPYVETAAARKDLALATRALPSSIYPADTLCSQGSLGLKPKFKEEAKLPEAHGTVVGALGLVS